MNVDGLIKTKIIIQHLVQNHKVTAIFLQETCTIDSSKLKICSYTLAAHTISNIYGIAIFVKKLPSGHIASSPSACYLERIATQVQGITVVYVYNPTPHKA